MKLGIDQNKLIRVKLITQADGVIPYIRITPESRGIVDNCQFFVDDDTVDADWCVVAEGLANKKQVLCPKENTILIAGETELTKRYDQGFLNQFHWVITCQKQMNHPRKIFTRQGYFSYLFLRRRLPGETMEEFQRQYKQYDELRGMADIPKTKLMSVVVSHKTRTDGAKQRRQFILKLKEHFGDRLDVFSNRPDVFGPDTKVSKIKWNAVAPYKYHIAIENSYIPHYWTDKILDSYLAGSYPFYYGHPNVTDYFPLNSLAMIDINDVQGSIAIIEEAIRGNYFEKNIKYIWQARSLALDKYNIFQTIVDVINSLAFSNAPSLLRLEPEKKPIMSKIIKMLGKVPLVYGVARKIYRKYRGLRYNQKFND